MTPSSSTGSMARGMGRPRDKHNSRSSLLLLVGLVLLALVIISQLGENGFVSWLKLRHNVRTLEAETTRLEIDNKSLAGRIDAVTNDQATLEKIAREKFNMKRPNEEVLMVLPPVEGTDSAHNPGSKSPNR